MVQFLKDPVNSNKKNFNNSVHELFIFKILLIAIEWNHKECVCKCQKRNVLKELHHYLSIKS